MEEAGTEVVAEDFAGFYARYRLQVLAYCARRVGPTEAADACSETFLVAWRRRHELPTSTETLPYLYGIASRVVSNHRRSLRRRLRLDARLAGLGPVPEEDPSALVVRREQDLQLQAAVGRLGPRDREIVMLYAWEDLPRETIAHLLGMSKAAVDQRIHRAYRRLARVLESNGSAPRTSPPPVIEQGGET